MSRNSGAQASSASNRLCSIGMRVSGSSIWAACGLMICTSPFMAARSTPTGRMQTKPSSASCSACKPAMSSIEVLFGAE